MRVPRRTEFMDGTQEAKKKDGLFKQSMEPHGGEEMIRALYQLSIDCFVIKGLGFDPLVPIDQTLRDMDKEVVELEASIAQYKGLRAAYKSK